jgi:hypothetical protein
MGLRQTISEWVTTIKDALDFGPGFPDALEARRVLFAQEAARLQHLLEETRRASQEKDQLIAKLQAAGAVAGSMVIDGPACYIRRANTLEGPFCTSCFQRNHEIMRIAPAPKPKGNDGTPADWVQCARCRTPFRSDRISQYLNPVRVPAASRSPVGAPPKRDESRLGSPTSPGIGLDDRRPKTDDRRQSTEPQAAPSFVLRPPPSEQQGKPKPSQSQNPALEGSTTTQKDTLGTPSPNAIPRVEDPRPVSAQIAISPQESDTPKPVKTNRKPHKEPKRGTARLGKAPAAETGPVEESPQPQGIAIESPAPTPDSALEAPRPSRTRSRSRKPKDQRSEKAMMTDRSESTR